MVVTRGSSEGPNFAETMSVRMDIDESVDDSQDLPVKDAIEGLQNAAKRTGISHQGSNDVFDWTTFCRGLEATFRDAEENHPDNRRTRGVTLTSAADKGHLQFQCLDDCFANATLGDIKGIEFPGAYARQKVSDIWTAWKVASIFVRDDLTMKDKLRLYKERAVCLDARALHAILRLAYEVCTEWTEFVCTTDAIKKHSTIEDNCVLPFYEKAFAQLKKEIADENKAVRPPKPGPTGFAAPESALLLDRDGPRGNLVTRVVTSFKELKEVLQSWTPFGVWVVVYPVDDSQDRVVIEDVVKLMRRHVELGGRIVTAWTPITEEKEAQWRKVMKLWQTIDSAIEAVGGVDQVVLTANTRELEGKLFIEAGSPESACQFYFAYQGVAAAKHLYEVIRKRVPQLGLPDIKQDHGLARTPTLKRGGMSGLGKEGGPKERAAPKRRKV